MNDTDYITATRRTDPDAGYRADGDIVRRIAKNPGLVHYVLGIVTEAGELADALKRSVIYGADLDTINVIEEIGDILWYQARLLDLLGSDFGHAMDRNIAKLRKRYPEKFTEHAALNRDLDAEREELEVEPQQSGFDAAPAHYAGSREVIDLIRDSMNDREFVGFCNGNALKYELRDGKKGDPVGDKLKAEWYRDMAAHVALGMDDPRSSRDGWTAADCGYARRMPVPQSAAERFASIGRAVVLAIASPGAEDYGLAHAQACEVVAFVTDAMEGSRQLIELEQKIMDAVGAADE